MEELRVELKRPGTHVSFGFNVGTSRGHHVVSSVSPDGLSQGKLLVDDEIVAVNGQDVSRRSHDFVVSLLCRDVRLELLVHRRPRARQAWGADPDDSRGSLRNGRVLPGSAIYDEDHADGADDSHDVRTTKLLRASAEPASPVPGAPSPGADPGGIDYITPSRRPPSTARSSRASRRQLPSSPGTAGTLSSRESLRKALTASSPQARRKALEERAMAARRRQESTLAAAAPSHGATIKASHETIVDRLTKTAETAGWTAEQLNRKIAEEKARERRQRLTEEAAAQADRHTTARPAAPPTKATKRSTARKPSYQTLPGFLAQGEVVHRTVQKNGRRLGLSIIGGTDTDLGAVFIKHVKSNSAMADDGAIEPGDKVLELNGEE